MTVEFPFHGHSTQWSSNFNSQKFPWHVSIMFVIFPILFGSAWPSFYGQNVKIIGDLTKEGSLYQCCFPHENKKRHATGILSVNKTMLSGIRWQPPTLGNQLLNDVITTFLSHCHCLSVVFSALDLLFHARFLCRSNCLFTAIRRALQQCQFLQPMRTPTHTVKSQCGCQWYWFDHVLKLVLGEITKRY